MDSFDYLNSAWSDIETSFMASPAMKRLATKDLTLLHYASYLRETYFYTREDPQIQASCTAYFRGEDRSLVKAFLQHAISEIGHDGLALSDLNNLGFETVPISMENPLPETMALISFPYYAMQYRSPYSYLGYLYFLEFAPTSRGSEIILMLRNLGVQEGALSFLHEHNTVDVHHNKLMRHYANEMLRSETARDEVVYSMSVTSKLFTNMLQGAFLSIDTGNVLLKPLELTSQKKAG